MRHLPAATWILLVGWTTADAQVIYNSASTAAEGYQRGMASVIAADGMRNLSNSQAAINATDARSRAIDNQLKSIDAFWEARDIYNTRQQEHFAQIQAKRSTYLERHGLGYLTPQEFDRTTGAVTWPRIMEQPQYDSFRNTLNELFQRRAYQGALTGDEFMKASAACRDWRAFITSENQYSSSIRSQMLRFILKLQRELDDNMG